MVDILEREVDLSSWMVLTVLGKSQLYSSAGVQWPLEGVVTIEMWESLVKVRRLADSKSDVSMLSLESLGREEG